MFRKLTSVLGTRPLWAALGLFAAAPFVLVSVSSVTVSPVDIASGGLAVGTVTLSAPSRTGTTISLSSSKSTVAAPTSGTAFVPSGRSTAGFKVSGKAAGCTNITAREGLTSSRQTLIYVLPAAAPASPFKLSLSTNSTVGGMSLTGSVSLTVSNPSSTLVQLSSDNPNVTVPATAQLSVVEGGIYIASFPINTSVVAPSTCAVITATLGTSRASALLKVATISG